MRGFWLIYIMIINIFAYCAAYKSPVYFVLRNMNFKFKSASSKYPSCTELAILTCAKHTWQMLISRSNTLWLLLNKLRQCYCLAERIAVGAESTQQRNLQPYTKCRAEMKKGCHIVFIYLIAWIFATGVRAVGDILCIKYWERVFMVLCCHFRLEFCFSSLFWFELSPGVVFAAISHWRYTILEGKCSGTVLYPLSSSVFRTYFIRHHNIKFSQQFRYSFVYISKIIGRSLFLYNTMFRFKISFRLSWI